MKKKAHRKEKEEGREGGTEEDAKQMKDDGWDPLDSGEAGGWEGIVRVRMNGGKRREREPAGKRRGERERR